MELVIASSPLDSGISCWDLNTGAEQLHYKSCTSASHGLVCVGGRFLASSQLRDSSASSGSILYWDWHRPRADVRSFPAEPISPLASNRDGTFIIGGGSQSPGYIYIWEVASGKLLEKQYAHHRAVTCLVLSEDESLIISGSEDGCVRVWSFIMIFDDIGNKAAKDPYVHSFTGHTLRVTDVVSGSGGCNAIIVSASEDRTCKIWSISKGKLLRTIDFPSIIDAIALDPGEQVFYAGSRDGKIYIGSLNGESSSKSSYGLHIVGALSEQSKAVTCLALNTDGNLLVSGLVDGTIRIWDIKAQQIIRMLKHSKGPVNNLIVVRRSLSNSTSVKFGSGRLGSALPPPLDRDLNSGDDNAYVNPRIALPAPCSEPLDVLYRGSHVMQNQIKELEQHGSSAASEMEMEKHRADCKRTVQMAQQWKKMYEELHHLLVDELVDAGPSKGM